MRSPRFRDLQRRLTQLRQRFLPRKLSATGDYTELQLDRARGYRLLAHAEIEAFLEDVCKEVANSTLKQFRIDRQPKLVLLNILAFHLVQSPLSEPSIKTIFTTKLNHCENALTRANSAYNHMLANNHGIKELNLLRMLLPIGLNPIHIDSTWVGTLDTFGRDRGNVAHTSIKTQQQIDPRNELKTVGDILAGLKTLDELIRNLM